MEKTQRLEVSLFALRATVGLVMLIWTIDKFIRPDHAASIFADFYFLKNVAHTAMYTVGIIELGIVILFLAGVMKKYTYGFVMLVHAISTISSFKLYLQPYTGPNILFFAAWPMLAAALTLFLLRQEDRLFTFKRGEWKKVGPARVA